MKGNETFGQLPLEFSQIVWHFLAHGEKKQCRSDRSQVTLSAAVWRNGGFMPVGVQLFKQSANETLGRTTPGLEPEHANKRLLKEPPFQTQAVINNRF